MMNNVGILAALMIIYASVALGQQVNLGRCERTFEASLKPGSNLRIQTRSGDIDVVGSPDPKVVVTCESTEEGKWDGVEVKLAGNSAGSDLKISGGPRNRFRLRIQVPDRLNLSLRCTAGDVDIRGITGDKDVSLTAGDLSIDVGSPGDYARSEASVRAGDLRASAFGVYKGGLFRSFKRTNPNGKYVLDVRLFAGDLTLR